MIRNILANSNSALLNGIRHLVHILDRGTYAVLTWVYKGTQDEENFDKKWNGCKPVLHFGYTFYFQGMLLIGIMACIEEAVKWLH